LLKHYLLSCRWLSVEPEIRLLIDEIPGYDSIGIPLNSNPLVPLRIHIKG